MRDEELADEIIDRLNALIPTARQALETIIAARLPVELDPEHPSIQVWTDDGRVRVGFLGMLNGLVGVMPSGPRAGWGYIAARFESDGTLLSFERTAPDAKKRHDGEGAGDGGT